MEMAETGKKIEVTVPIYDETLKERIRHIFDTIMADDEKGKEQNKEGEYLDREGEEKKINSQEIFYEEAYQNT